MFFLADINNTHKTNTVNNTQAHTDTHSRRHKRTHAHTRTYTHTHTHTTIHPPVAPARSCQTAASPPSGWLAGTLVWGGGTFFLFYRTTFTANKEIEMIQYKDIKNPSSLSSNLSGTATFPCKGKCIHKANSWKIIIGHWIKPNHHVLKTSIPVMYTTILTRIT